MSISHARLLFDRVKFFHDSLNRINVAGCLIVFSGVVLYKITHHFDKHDKDHGESDGIVRYRHVNGDQIDIDERGGEEDEEEMWMNSVSVEMLHNGDKEKAYEMESVGIQMGLPTVQVAETEEDDSKDEENDDESAIRHRIT